MRIPENLDTKPLIEFKAVDFRYKSANKNLFNEINCTFNSHNFYLLTGDSGAGKTSFLKLIFRGALPTGGDVYVLGQNTKKLSPTTLPLFRQKIGIIPQNCQLFEHLTIKENVALPLKMVHSTKYSAEVYAMELIDWVELGQYANCYPKELSSGQRLHIAVARAVIRKPKIILADELTGNIDEVQSTKIMGLFHELSKTGTTVILSTHDRNFASAKGLCEVRLRNGNLHSQKSLKTVPLAHPILRGHNAI